MSFIFAPNPWMDQPMDGSTPWIDPTHNQLWSALCTTCLNIVANTVITSIRSSTFNVQIDKRQTDPLCRRHTDDPMATSLVRVQSWVIRTRQCPCGRGQISSTFYTNRNAQRQSKFQSNVLSIGFSATLYTKDS